MVVTVSYRMVLPLDVCSRRWLSFGLLCFGAFLSLVQAPALRAGTAILDFGGVAASLQQTGTITRIGSAHLQFYYDGGGGAAISAWGSAGTFGPYNISQYDIIPISGLPSADVLAKAQWGYVEMYDGSGNYISSIMLPLPFPAASDDAVYRINFATSAINVSYDPSPQLTRTQELICLLIGLVLCYLVLGQVHP